VATSLCTSPIPAQTADAAASIAHQVEIIRTQYGVPHIRAGNLRAAFLALGYVQSEDYGRRVAMGLFRGRGEMGKFFGRDSMEGDFVARPLYQRAVETYHLLEQDTRDAYEGFAAGVNLYIDKHPSEFPAGFKPGFTGYDILARDIEGSSAQAARRFLAKHDPRSQPRSQQEQAGTEGEVDPSNVGSNAWAFAPGRTKSGRAILLRNPHLNWNAGYYEAHMTVPGKFDFYGDFRIGGPFSAVGGFNSHLGWATTNNAPDLDEVYALDAAPGATDSYVFDGVAVPLTRQQRTVEYRNGEGISTETREFWATALGPVILRRDGKIYIVRTAAEGSYRHGEQFLHMMRARSLAEWKDAMRIRARVTSSFTYADRAGNIFYIWNAALPARPHRQGGDTVAIPARRTADVFTHLVPFDSLPQLLNPPGGYIHNENNSPFYTNMNRVLDTAAYPAGLERPSLSLRAQHGLQLVSGKEKLSLDDVNRLKHSYRMLLADRIKDDLVAAVRGDSRPLPVEAGDALRMLERWDNRAAPDSRGAVLFEMWYRRYADSVAVEFAKQWTPSDPARTPDGLAEPARAREAFVWAVSETARRYGSADVAWGDVHRVRLGNVDVPVGGCSGQLGCFRVLNFRADRDGKLAANGGDGWILAVEFTDVPRAMSVLGYGQSSRPESPHSSDQAELFARGELKQVHYTHAAVERNAARRYRPGEEQ
jgi:acyl-homoserine-lactone acylase